MCSYSTKGQTSLVIEAEAEREGEEGARGRDIFFIAGPELKILYTLLFY